MICPNNKCPDYLESGSAGEYVPGVTVCPTCGEYLVEKLGNDRSGDSDSEVRVVPRSHEPLEPVFESSDPSEIPVIQSLLESEGIRFVTSGEERFDAFRGGLSPFRINPTAGVVSFLVPVSQAETARALLSEFDDES
jgi:hypothetical protein